MVIEENEIKPITLNLTMNRLPDLKVVVELRKKFIINLKDDHDFWIDFFSKSIENKPVKAPMIIVFRDKFGSACKLKELGLLKKGTKIPLE